MKTFALMVLVLAFSPVSFAQKTETQDNTRNTGSNLASPAHLAYSELLKNGDVSLLTAIYACFEDDPQSDFFFVMSAHFISKQELVVTLTRFTKGVADPLSAMFGGEIDSMSNGEIVFAKLPTLYDYKEPSHKNDAFDWSPYLLSMKIGFGSLLPGQVRFTEELNVQRSTGRYTDRIVFGNGFAPDGFTTETSGRCVRVPNIAQTPEEEHGNAK